MKDLVDINSVNFLKRQRSEIFEENAADMTSFVLPNSNRNRKHSHLQIKPTYDMSMSLGKYKSQENLLKDMKRGESNDKFDQFNKFLLKNKESAPGDRTMIRKIGANSLNFGSNKDYLLAAKILQKKHNEKALKQAQFVQRLTGNNQAHLAKKLVST